MFGLNKDDNLNKAQKSFVSTYLYKKDILLKGST